MNRYIGKQSLTIFISTILGIVGIGVATSVKAQIDPNPETINTPKFTNAEKADKLKPHPRRVGVVHQNRKTAKPPGIQNPWLIAKVL